MKRQQLIAITRRQGALPDGMHAIVMDDVAAVFASLPRNMSLTRRGMLRTAAQRQACLEGLMQQDAVLPVLPGQTVPRGDVARMLRANQPALERKLDDLHGKAQYQITFAIDEANAMARLARPGSPFQTARDTEDLRSGLAMHFEDCLQAPGTEVTMLPLAGNLVANAVVLVDKATDAALHETVADIDALWPEGIKLRMIGPSPAVSFASVGFLKTDKSEISRALALLDVDIGAAGDEAAIANAKKTVLRKGLSDAEQVRLAAEIVGAAGRLKEADVAPFHRVMFWAEGMAATSPAKLREAA